MADSHGRIVGPLIELARCSKFHRIIVAGSKGTELMSELYLRGYVRVATTATCGSPRGQYDVALVGWQGRSIKALETTLDWLVHFLASSPGFVLRIHTPERPTNRKLAPTLESPGATPPDQRPGAKPLYTSPPREPAIPSPQFD